MTTVKPKKAHKDSSAENESLSPKRRVKSKKLSNQQKTRLYKASVAWKSVRVLDSDDAFVKMLWLQQTIRCMLVSRDLFVYEPNAIRPSPEQQYISGNERILRFTFSFLEMPLQLSPSSFSVPFMISSCCYLRYTTYIIYLFSAYIPTVTPFYRFHRGTSSIRKHSMYNDPTS